MAHSAGATAGAAGRAALAGRVCSLVLFEPACIALTRGRAAVEGHLSATAPVLARADDPGVDDVAYAKSFFGALGATPPPAETAEQSGAATSAHGAGAWTVDLGDRCARVRVHQGGEPAQCLTANAAQACGWRVTGSLTTDE
jgi:hypothetical protein